MGSKRQISLVDLRKKQEQISAAIVAAEKAERGKIGARIQAMTGLETLAEIEAQYTLKKRVEAVK